MRNDKALHGQYPKIAAASNESETYRWIKNSYMRKETEGLITAAQDQALLTRWRKVNVGKRSGTKYRMCNDKDESIFHILSECEYRKRRDRVTQIVHLNLYHIQKKWFDFAEKVTENEEAKLL